jgi:hypothetical protein
VAAQAVEVLVHLQRLNHPWVLQVMYTLITLQVSQFNQIITFSPTKQKAS